MASARSSIPAVEHLHAADTPELVRAPATTFVSIGGSGRPGTDAFYRKKRLATEVARGIPGDHDPTVVELLYWFPEAARPVEIADFYWVNPIDDLRYRVLVRVPRDTGPEQLAAARRAVADVSDDDVELFALPEQTVVQLCHHGPFADEVRTLSELGAFARDQGLRRSGPHHEIHLDPFGADTPQETLRTILRDPVVAG